MAMMCPQCSEIFEQRLQCPTCGVRLIVAARGASRRMALLASSWQHTQWGRLVIGLLLAEGLFFGLRHLLTGVIVLVNGPGSAQEILATLPAMIGVQAIQVVALLLGAMLAGAGKRGGSMLGLMMGVVAGVIAIVAQQWQPTASNWWLPIYCQPLVQGTIGFIGGFVGSTIWRPLAVVLSAEDATIKRKVDFVPPTPMFAGPIHWFRILIGSGFAVAGWLSATYLLDRALLASNDALSTEGVMQEQIVVWEIKALAMLLGAALAGTCTMNGFKQGLFVGVLTGCILNAVLAYRGMQFDVVGLTMLSTMSLSISGGWFGGQLFPPVSPFARQRGMGPASV
jgi:hypothetical protein